jgi:signal transduction histidine kinase
MTSTMAVPAREKNLNWLSWLVLGLLLFTISWLLSLTYPIDELGKRANDTYFRLQQGGSRSPAVELVLIDDASLGRYGRWPWPRTRLADLIGAVSAQRPRAIGLDILLSELEDERNDRALQESIRAAGNVVLADRIAGSASDKLWVEPLPRFQSVAAGVGHVQVALDGDGICRSVPALELSLDGPRWAFAMVVTRVAIARPHDQNKGTAHPGGRILPVASQQVGQDLAGVETESLNLLTINYRPQLAATSDDASSPFRIISAGDLLSGKSNQKLSGKIVLIGFASTGLSDQLMTPVSNGIPMPGVEIHANLIDSVLQGTTLHGMGGRAQILLLFALSLVLAFFAFRSGLVSLLWLVGLLVVEYAAGYFLFSYAHVQLQLGPILCATLLAAPFGQLWNLIMVNRGLNHSFRVLEHELQAAPMSTGAQLGSLTPKREEPAEGRDLSWKLSLLTRTHAELGSLYAFHQTLFESMQEGLAVFGADGSILFYNRGWLEFCELQRCDPQHALQILDDAFHGSQWRQLRPAESLDPVATEVHIGYGLWNVQTERLPWTSHAGSTAFMVILANRTAAMERDCARSEALHFVTHELRTPLVAIQGLAELMQRFPDRSPAPESAGVMFREARRLVAMIDTYLDVLRLDSGHLVPRQEPVDIAQLLSEVTQVLRPLADSGDITLHRDLGPDLQLVRGDPSLLGGALLNLVSNAIKYSPEGSVVQVRAVQQDENLALEIWNDGPFIPEDQLQRLFRPFHRGAGEHNSRPGWGLGLAFVKRIADQHGGKILVQSDPNLGTCFTLLLRSENAVQRAIS